MLTAKEWTNEIIAQECKKRYAIDENGFRIRVIILSYLAVKFDRDVTQAEADMQRYAHTYLSLDVVRVPAVHRFGLLGLTTLDIL